MTDKIFKSLAGLYTTMDTSYDKIGTAYNFKCKGCEDNCCKSLFFHHTYIEKAYLLYGFNMLDHKKREKIIIRAQNYCKKTFSKGLEAKSLKIYCPLNEKGQCIVYFYRPMICRLHGLPHELNKTGVNSIRKKGCDAGLFDDKAYVKFDRTPFYRQMVQIETIFRNEFNKTGKIKETIAQMLVSS